MVKNDKYYRDKMIEDIDFIIEQMAEESKDSLDKKPILLDSMMFRLIQISESARNLSEEYKAQYENVPWSAIYGLRNRIVHDYGNVDLEIIYNTLTKDISDVKKYILGL